MAQWTVPSSRPLPGLFQHLNPSHWEEALKQCGLEKRHGPLLSYLCDGFSYHSTVETNATLVYPNAPGAINNPDAVLEIFQREVDLERYLGPFDAAEVSMMIGRPFICHPIDLVDKSNGKKRLVENLSFPHNRPSLNSLTNHEDFSLNWGSFADAVELVVTAPPGSQGATVDWKDAFRMLGIRPDEWWMGIVHFSSRYWIDRCLKFGGSISTFNFELVAAAFADIFHFRFADGKLIYWVDDDLIRRSPTNQIPNAPPLPPWTYSFDIQNVLDLGASLDAVFPPEKVVDFDFTSKYIGYMWHWDTKEVALPEKKRIAYLDVVSSLQASDDVSLKDLRSLCGKLAHCAAVKPHGRSKLRSLYDLKTRMEAAPRPHPLMKWHWESSQSSALRWWFEELNKPNTRMKLCSHPRPNSPLKLYCDASTSFGIGIVIDDMYESFQFEDGWESAGGISRSIGWAESAAVEILIYYALRLPGGVDENTHLEVFSDNSGVVGSWAKRSSRNPDHNEILGRIITSLLAKGCFLTVTHVSTHDNPADLPSRGKHLPSYRRTTFAGFPPQLAGLLRRSGPLI